MHDASQFTSIHISNYITQPHLQELQFFSHTNFVRMHHVLVTPKRNLFGSFLGRQFFFFLRYKYASCIKRLKVHSLGTLPFVDQPCLDKYMPFLQDLQIRNRGDLLHAFFLLRLDFVPYQVENKQMLWPCTSTPHFLSFCKEKERHRCSH